MNTNQLTTVTNKVNVNDLKPGYSIFGNKGNVWNDECHISKSDFSGRTMCGVPMLSSNWDRIENVHVVGCPKCNKLYNI